MKQQPIAADQTPTTRLLRKPAVLARVPMSDTTLWRRVKDGGFPAPVKISTNAIAWREADIEQWIAERVG
jgi:predicted DNA-binding transcriptional regulator AlpA